MINPEFYQDDIFQFFDYDKPAPKIFKNVEKLREEVIRREKFIHERSVCVSCDIVQFRAYFIETNLIPNIIDANKQCEV